MCEHCDVLSEVLTQLTGEKVAAVIMRRVVPQVHGNEVATHAVNPLLVTTT